MQLFLSRQNRWDKNRGGETRLVITGILMSNKTPPHSRPSNTTLLWDYIGEGGKRYKDMNRLVAYYKGMTTWSRWVNRFVNPSKTKVFFQGISPVHYEGREWNQPSKSCKSETQPFFGLRYPAGTPMASVVLNKVLSRVKKPVYLLDITTLSQYRKDAHPTFYSGNHIGLDCSHWCLPGLPDTWNLLMNAALSR